MTGNDDDPPCGYWDCGHALSRHEDTGFNYEVCLYGETEESERQCDCMGYVPPGATIGQYVFKVKTVLGEVRRGPDGRFIPVARSW